MADLTTLEKAGICVGIVSSILPILTVVRGVWKFRNDYKVWIRNKWEKIVGIEKLKDKHQKEIEAKNKEIKELSQNTHTLQTILQFLTSDMKELRYEIGVNQNNTCDHLISMRHGKCVRFRIQNNEFKIEDILQQFPNTYLKTTWYCNDDYTFKDENAIKLLNYVITNYTIR